MKKFIFTLVLSLVFTTLKTTEAPVFEILKKEVKKEVCYIKLLKAIIKTESGGNPLAVGKDQDVGILQITPIRLADYNKKTGKNYSTSDIWNPEIQFEIFHFYAEKIGTHPSKYEEIARRWNGGQDGMKKQSTEKYWKIVQTNLKEIV